MCRPGSVIPLLLSRLMDALRGDSVHIRSFLQDKVRCGAKNSSHKVNLITSVVYLRFEPVFIVMVI